MSEKEIIDRVMMIEQWKVSGDIYTQDELNAIGELLDLYNKEKEKNYNLTHVLFTGESDYISKDKIKDLFKKYENEHFIPKAEIQKLLEK